MADSQWSQRVRDFWNDRAGLKERAGSDDLIAKQLEIEAIARYLRDGMRILEVGCGNGITAIELARRFQVDITGIDFAPEMVAAARVAAEAENLKGKLLFQVGDVQNLTGLREKFDLAYTERVLINLPDWPTQRQAIINITDVLAESGLYVMCENSQEGLDQINEFRSRVGLPPITPPWHNRYLRDAEIQQAKIPGIHLEGISHFSSTYYFVSRVINAWLAAQEGKKPAYDAPVNRIALQLPPLGEFGQGRIWLWRKSGIER